MSVQVLEIVRITKYYGAKLILDQVSLLINRADRIGLVGENGTGKTTLANIVMGVVEPDEGQVRLSPNLEIGYLPQEAAIDDDITVQTFLERAMGRLDRLRAELSTLEEALADATLATGSLAALLDQYGLAQEEFTRRGGYEADYRLSQVFPGLDVS